MADWLNVSCRWLLIDDYKSDKVHQKTVHILIHRLWIVAVDSDNVFLYALIDSLLVLIAFGDIWQLF